MARCLTAVEICQLLQNPDCCPNFRDEHTYRQYVVGLLCSLTSSVGTPSIDTEVIILCDPSSGARVVVAYRYLNGVFTFVGASNVDGTAYAGAVNSLVSCNDIDTTVIQYEICDNGVTKLVRVCFNGCVKSSVEYFLLNETASTAPLDFNLVSLGACSVPVTSYIVEQGCYIPTVGGQGRPVQAVKGINSTGQLVSLVLYESDVDGFGVPVIINRQIGDSYVVGACVEAPRYPYIYETCATLAGDEIQVRVFEVRDAIGVVINRRIELLDGTDVTLAATIAECATCCDAPLIPLADTRCSLYGRFLAHKVAELSNPALFDDPSSNGPIGSPDYSCNNHFPISLVVYAVSVDGVVVSTGPQVVAVWNSIMDVPLNRGGVAIHNYVNNLPAVLANGTAFDLSNPLGIFVNTIAANPEVRFIYGHILDSQPCNLDPYHRYWTDEFNVLSSLGDAIFIENIGAGNPLWVTTQPTPSDYLANALVALETALDGGVESCTAI